MSLQSLADLIQDFIQSYRKCKFPVWITSLLLLAPQEKCDGLVT